MLWLKSGACLAFSCFFAPWLILSTGQTCTGGWQLSPTPWPLKQRTMKWFTRTGVRKPRTCTEKTQLRQFTVVVPNGCGASDCPQVQCVEQYVGQQADELNLEPTDIINVIRKTNEGRNTQGTTKASFRLSERRLLCYCSDVRMRWICACLPSVLH